jgi:hypothetical protein
VKSHTTHLRLKCVEPDRCSIVFEPYGAEVVLLADDELRVRVVTTDEAEFEIAYAPGCISVWLPTSVVSFWAKSRLDDAIDLGLPE